MQEHLSAETIERLQRRQLEPDRLISASDHLTECELCRTRLDEVARPWEAIAGLREELRATAFEENDHLSDTQVLAWVKSRADDVESEIIVSHLEVCNRCAEIASAVKRTLAAPEVKSRSIARGAGSYSWFLAAAALLIAAAGLAWLLSLPYRREISRLEARLGEVERSNEDLRGKVAAAQTTPGGSSSGEAGLVAALNDAGGRITLSSNGKISGIDSLSSEQEGLLVEALKSGSIRTPSILTELAGRKGQLLGGDNPQSFAVLQPVGVVIESQRPAFRWKKLEGAVSYVVRVYDPRLNIVASSDAVTTTTWGVPKALARGQVYGWTVTAKKEDGTEVTTPAPPAPEAKFRVLSNAEAETLNRARREHKDSHLILGLTYARTGLITEAEQELSALAQANPDSQLAKNLLATIRRIR